MVDNKKSYSSHEIAQIVEIYHELTEELSGRVHRYFSEQSAREALEQIWLSIPEDVRENINNSKQYHSRVENLIDDFSRKSGEGRTRMTAHDI